MESRRNFCQIIKCGLSGWRILKLVKDGFVGAPVLLENIDVTVHVLDLAEINQAKSGFILLALLLYNEDSLTFPH